MEASLLFVAVAVFIVVVGIHSWLRQDTSALSGDFDQTVIIDGAALNLALRRAKTRKPTALDELLESRRVNLEEARRLYAEREK